MPVTATLNEVLLPAQTVELAGCVVMFTGVLTVSRPQFDVAAGAQAPLITQRYPLPFMVAGAAVIVNVAVVTPE